jgi:uncharacterized RDD family membrane protein YckC
MFFADVDIPRAPVTRRLMAGLLDLSVVAIAVLGLRMAPGGAVGILNKSAVFSYLRFVPFFYLLLRDAAGASLGKHVMGLRVYDRKLGEPAGSLVATLRNWPLLAAAVLVLPLPFWSLLGLVIALLGVQVLVGRKCRFGDGWACTQVVEVRWLRSRSDG